MSIVVFAHTYMWFFQLESIICLSRTSHMHARIKVLFYLTTITPCMPSQRAQTDHTDGHHKLCDAVAHLLCVCVRLLFFVHKFCLFEMVLKRRRWRLIFTLIIKLCSIFGTYNIQTHTCSHIALTIDFRLIATVWIWTDAKKMNWIFLRTFKWIEVGGGVAN